MLTDAPNAVVKLREIILQLAVMGKLVPPLCSRLGFQPNNRIKNLYACPYQISLLRFFTVIN
ncbi:hypothetical protein BZZ01_04365 [Nostocales cyanobacterium HT-58-2]|nr:hypothetical protein BZZ01_04365 [Nostocales cyanobacterium HT-58-2]